MKRLAFFALTGMSAAAIALTGCSSNPPEQDNKVATLKTDGADASGDSSPGSAEAQDAERPRERLDMTDEEKDRLFEAYNRCLSEHESGPGGRRPPQGTGVAPVPVDPEVEKRAKEACRSKEPLPPWEFDANNPQAADFVHAVVQCLRDKGVKYVDEEGAEDGRYVYSFGGPNNDSESISKGMRLAPECEKEVAERGIGR